MVTLLVFAALAGSTDPGRIVPASADRALVTPQAGTGASEAHALLSVAGARAPLLGPASLGGGWEHELSVNPFNPASLEAAGVAAQQPLAVATVARVDLLAFGAGDGARVRSHLDAWMSGLGGTVETVKHRGLSIQVARFGKEVAAAFALKGGRVAVARATASGGDPVAVVESSLEEKKSLASLRAWRGLAAGTRPWRLWIKGQGKKGPLAAALSRSGNELSARGSIRIPSPSLLPGNPAPASVPDVPGALGVVRMRLNGGAPLADALSWLVGQACPSCDAALQRSAGWRLSALASGPAVMAIDGIDLRALAAGRAPASAFPTVWALPVSDGNKAAAVASEVAGKLGASQGEGANWSAPSADGRVFFGVDHGVVYLATDPGARDRDLAALAAPGTADPASPLVARIHPEVLGKALARVSALDALTGGALAGLFAAKLEVGSFLRGAGPILVEARPAGPDVYAFDLTWNLVP